MRSLFLILVLASGCKLLHPKHAVAPVKPAPLPTEKQSEPETETKPEHTKTVIKVVEAPARACPDVPPQPLCPAPPPIEVLQWKSREGACPDAFAACLTVDGMRNLLRYVRVLEEYSRSACGQ